MSNLVNGLKYNTLKILYIINCLKYNKFKLVIAIIWGIRLRNGWKFPNFLGKIFIKHNFYELNK